MTAEIAAARGHPLPATDVLHQMACPARSDLPARPALPSGCPSVPLYSPLRLFRNDRNRFYLYQQLFTDEPSHLHSRTCRWLLGVDVLIAHGSHYSDLRDVEQKVGQF